MATTVRKTKRNVMISLQHELIVRKHRIAESMCVLFLAILCAATVCSAAQQLQERDDGMHYHHHKLAHQAAYEIRVRDYFEGRTRLIEEPPEMWQDPNHLQLCHVNPETELTECFDANDQHDLIHTQFHYALKAQQLISQHLYHEHDDEDDDEDEDEPIVPPNCNDVRPRSCPERAAKGDCQDPQHILYMQAHCPVSCGTCHNRTKLIVLEDEVHEKRKDVSDLNRELIKAKEEEDDDDSDDEDDDDKRTKNTKKRVKQEKSLQEKRRENERTPFSRAIRDERIPVIDAVGSDLGVPQVIDIFPSSKFESRKQKTDRLATRRDALQALSNARIYMRNEVMVDDFYRLVREKCRNKHAHCTLWAIRGDCQLHSEFMTQNCAPMCEKCEELHYETRCPVDHNQPLALYPGDLNKMFRRIVDTYQHSSDGNAADSIGTSNKPNMTITVLSRPDLADGDMEETADYEVGGPWMVLFDNFASPEECEALIKEGATKGYERSEDVGDEDEDTGEMDSVVSSGRTSTNAWCCYVKCEKNPLVQPVVQRIETVTGISRNYSEQLQLLRYQPGQFYNVHHDYIENEQYRISGNRILTLFIYLNDVEEGGATDFPELEIRVQPKRGSALLWPSVLDEDPHEKDVRTDHQALPVIRGVKYGANAWLHQRQFRTAYMDGC